MPEVKMRDDAQKVWSEPGRSGGKCRSRKYGRRRELWKKYVGDAPSKMSMRSTKHRCWYKGSQVENWNPLKRFLLKSVGRHWDKVFSEICKAFRKDVNGVHPKEAVFWWVERNIIMKKRKPFVYESGYPSQGYDLRPLVNVGKDLKLWIHPKTGQLLKAPPREPKWWKPKKSKKRKK
jgi:hypothetical protein